jgi:hypothetical protein
MARKIHTKAGDRSAHPGKGTGAMLGYGKYKGAVDINDLPTAVMTSEEGLQRLKGGEHRMIGAAQRPGGKGY